jgi:hypothetical protein
MTPRGPRLRGIADLHTVSSTLLGVLPVDPAGAVVVFDAANFQGASLALGLGTHALPDFAGRVQSIRVPHGLVAYAYEDVDNGGGFGRAVDLLEDIPDLASLDLAQKISFINVFGTEHDGMIWARGAQVGAEYIPGHWERQRANGQKPPDNGPAVSPPIPPHDLAQPPVSGGTPAVPNSDAVSNHEIATFELFGFVQQSLWDTAVTRQQGIIGSDYRGLEPVGSAAFERVSHDPKIPDFINFWYPQAQPHDHRGDGAGHFKRTLSGRRKFVEVANVVGTYQDLDLNLDIVPIPEHQALLTDAHPKEYTDIMQIQWTASGHKLGHPNCDDEDFSRVEAEIDSSDSAKARILDAFLQGDDMRQACVYGTWIYDRGHCCHSEIHPAEQVWWCDQLPDTTMIYQCALLVDESERFWWRDQMDDGEKLKPWGAPPLTGTFAVGFETRVNAPAVEYTIVVDEVANDVTVADHASRHHLVYGGTTLVAVVQDPATPVKVSFEHVGLVEPDVVRGFIVLEATVGTCTQIATTVHVDGHDVSVPAGSDVNKVREEVEREAFRKQAGRLHMHITTGPYTGPEGPLADPPLVNA